MWYRTSLIEGFDVCEPGAYYLEFAWCMINDGFSGAHFLAANHELLRWCPYSKKAHFLKGTRGVIFQIHLLRVHRRFPPGNGSEVPHDIIRWHGQSLGSRDRWELGTEISVSSNMGSWEIPELRGLNRKIIFILYNWGISHDFPLLHFITQRIFGWEEILLG